MPTRSKNTQLQELQAEVQRLQADNQRLHRELSAASQPASKKHKFTWKSVGSSICVVITAMLVAVANILFWAGNTIVRTDDYVNTTAPIIKDSAVQSAIANYTTDQLFQNIDVTQIAQDALPPRADFLAPSIAAQLQTYTASTLTSILASQQFQQRWNTAQEHIHDRFITIVNTAGSDGTIDIGEIYSQASQNLKGTKLAFLADKSLPPTIGTVQVVSGDWIVPLRSLIQYIDIWRTAALLLFIALAAGGVWLSRNRRRTVMILSAISIIFFFLTLVASRIVREIAASKVDAQYADAARNAYSLFAQGLVAQTYAAIAIMVIVMIVAWMSSNSPSSQTFKEKLTQLFSGRIHTALFGNRENNFTIWVGSHKLLLQWLATIAIACVILFVRITPGVVIAQVIGIIITVLIIEIMAARLHKIT